MRDPSRPWWRRKLDLGLLGRDDRRQVIQAINAHYRLPDAPVVPESLSIRYRFNREATFEPAGIRHVVAGVTHVYGWHAVCGVMIERHDAVRRDFRTLDIELADPPTTIELWMHGTNPSWRGATAEELSEFISRHAPAERIEIAIDGDYAATPRLAEKRLAALRKHERELRSFWPIFGGVFAVAVAVLLAAEGTDALFTAIALGCFWLAMAGGFTFIARRDLRQRLE